MKKWMLSLMLVCLMSMSVSADTTGWTCPEGLAGQTLNVANWTTYIAADTIPQFEKLCDVTVNYTEYETDEIVLDALRRGDTSYDIVIPDITIVAVMIDEGLLETLDHNNIPNLQHLAADFRSLAYDPENRYSVPYQWGTLGIGYNKSTVTEDIKSWKDFFEYNGAVAWLDMSHTIIGIALLTLGYDPETTNLSEIAAARNFLIEHSPLTTIVPDSDGQKLLADGGADLVIEFSGDIFQLNRDCKCDDYAYVIPEEGTNFWIDAMVIAADAPNKALAEAFMDYVLDPQVSADISNFTAYATPNQTAIDEGLINQDYLDNPVIYPDEASRSKMFLLAEVTTEMEQVYQSAWDEIRILLGQ
jgi:spermidine/putrescine transport system substrate-binding protein